MTFQDLGRRKAQVFTQSVTLNKTLCIITWLSGIMDSDWLIAVLCVLRLCILTLNGVTELLISLRHYQSLGSVRLFYVF